jgi:uncharacterized protein DUF6502
VQRHKTRISPRRADALLFPIAALLRAGGLSKRSATKRLAAVFDRAGKLAGARRIEHIGRPVLYNDIVARWRQDPRFLDSMGRPRALSIKGKNQFSTLIREIDSACDPRRVMTVLVRFGNVRRASNSTYKLVRPLFFSSTDKALAFEPIAYFISDASLTLSHILRRTRRTRAPELFWRTVECTGLSTESARDFVAFANERGQEFLEEVDEWLEARARRGGSSRQRRRRRRVGLGLFSIDSENDLSHLTP